MVEPRPKLCIVSLYNYPLFNSACRGTFGGGEVRTALIARELARRSLFDLSMVVFDHGQPKVEQREGINFYAHTGYSADLSTFPAGTTLPISTLPTKRLRWSQRIYHQLFHWFHQLPPPYYNWGRWLQQFSKMIILSLKGRNSGRIGLFMVESTKIAIYDQINADIYMFPGYSHIAAELAFYCRQKGKKYIFLAGSDHDYSPKLKERLKKKDLTALPWAFTIEQAITHFVQSEHQAQLLHQHFGRTATIVRNPINLKRVFPKQTEGQTILWVGRSDQIKRPKIALQLARCCPEFHFTLIMTLWEQNIFDDCMAEAKTLPNVTLVPYIPYPEVERYFADAKLFINTSVFEGFPNAFLQAGKYELPIVSLQVDPGEMLSRHGCGLLCNGNFESLQKNVCQLMTTPTLYNDFSVRCLEYVRHYHDMGNIIDQYERALTSVLANNFKPDQL